MKFKKFILDILFNSMSLGIYIIAQQIIFMPIMSKTLPDADFSLLVIYTSIFAVISNTIGSELGIVRQVRDDKSNKNYNRILLYLLPVISIISLCILLFLKFSIVDSILLTLTILLANVRLYSAAIFRINKDFKKVLVQNILYLTGIVLGILVYQKLGYIWIPMLVAEILPLIFDFFHADITQNGIEKDENMKDICYKFIDLWFISLLINGMVYFDKFLIYPILGTMAVAIYYATTTMSKMISLIINPLYSVILSWIKGDTKKNKIIKFTIKTSFSIVLIVFILSLPLTYFAIKILYIQYLEQAKELIIPVCIGIAFYTSASLIKAVLLKYIKSKRLVKAYLIYLALFIIIAIPASKIYGLSGFAYANMISKIVLWMQFMCLLPQSIKKTRDEE